MGPETHGITLSLPSITKTSNETTNTPFEEKVQTESKLTKTSTGLSSRHLFDTQMIVCTDLGLAKKTEPHFPLIKYQNSFGLVKPRHYKVLKKGRGKFRNLIRTFVNLGFKKKY